MILQPQRRFFFNLLCAAALTTFSAICPGISSAANPTTPAPTTPQLYDLCARVEGKDPANPILQTLHIKLSLSGPEIAPALRTLVQAQLIAQVLERQGGALSVFLEDYEPQVCAASGDKLTEIALSVTQDEIDKINRDTVRGDARFPNAEAIAARAEVKIKLAASDKAQQVSIRLFYATNRGLTGKQETSAAFGNQAGSLSYGRVQVDVKRQPTMKNLETAAITKFENVIDLENFAVAGKFTPLTHEQWLAEVKARASKFNKAGVLLFIHGYNNTFVEAAAVAGQLTYDLAFPGASVLFSWPSQGKLLEYKQDSVQATAAAPSLAAVINDLTALQAEGPVYIVAHSMGNQVLLGGLKQFLKDSKAGQSRALTAVVMAAPDVPQENFKKLWGEDLTDNGIYPTLYASSNDLAIVASEKENKNLRLGSGGKAMFAMSYMVSIDASAVTKAFFSTNHAYFRDNDTVTGDLFGLIRERKAAEQRPKLKRVKEDYSSWVLQAGK